ncbi:hypothetical protein [Parendozoicomonas sp. Alg238-R29]|uniref:hypothetical protein n=1 Tax=Parendozoicomonas sp. Alg238-R29 TaxID=2993446 RepID=UPI00248DC8BB|nr:hypothetical protein [Parendozoicomonas sp. Alg238-R29]
MRLLLLTASLIFSSVYSYAASETTQEKISRYLEYTHSYNKNAGEHLFLFRSTVNPAILSSFILDGLDNLKSSAEYLEESLNLSGKPSTTMKKEFLDLSEKSSAFEAFYNMLKAWGESNFPGMVVKPKDFDSFQSHQQQSEQALASLKARAAVIEKKF